MAMACFRLFTLPPLPPLPERSDPFFKRRIALATRLPAAFPYFRPPVLRDLVRLLGAMAPPVWSRRDAVPQDERWRGL
jgi:hypothetical protein